MAVSQNPYESWQRLRQNSDYRSTDTQGISFTRQQLSNSEFLTRSNRVSPGPDRNSRTEMANNSTQVPHVMAPEDMWGWQQWAQGNTTPGAESSLATGLREQRSIETIPGASYTPHSRVGGATGFCSSCRRIR
jgi:hypothetical protein